jgi:hypothetical protein
MTNQLQFLDRANNVILINDGEIIAQGNFNYYLITYYKNQFYI